VPRRLDEADPGQELSVAVDGLEVQAFVVGLEVSPVERAVEAEGPLLLPGAADQAGVRLLEELDVAGVVEVQVGQDDVVDVTGATPSSTLLGWCEGGGEAVGGDGLAA